MIGQRVNAVNVGEPLSDKIHTEKPQHGTYITCLCEPCVPFLGMGRVGVNREDTHRLCLAPLPYTSKIHKVHATRQSLRRVAVLSREGLVVGVHTAFTRFTESLRLIAMPMIRRVATLGEASCPLARERHQQSISSGTIHRESLSPRASAPALFGR